MTGYALDLGQLRNVPYDARAVCVTRDDVDWYADTARARHEAAQACLTCPLIIQCTTAALVRGERYGVWGGLDFEDISRHALRRAVNATKGMTTRKRRTTALCGTKTGYDRHNRLREPSCPACLRARADYSAEMRARRRQPA